MIALMCLSVMARRATFHCDAEPARAMVTTPSRVPTKISLDKDGEE
jgi:hypothetical protein